MGIHQELTVPGTPQQTGVAERFNRVSLEMTRCLLLEEIRVRMRYGPAYSHAVEAIYLGEPGSYREAMASPDKEKLQTAMQDELNSLNDKSTWTLVDWPKVRKVITGRWVYKTKSDKQGNIDKFKGRYVVKGFRNSWVWNFTRRMLQRANKRH